MSHDAHLVDPTHVERADMDRYSSLAGLVAKGVAIVSTRWGRYDYATTVTDFLSVSYDPPTMLVSLYGLSRTTEAVEGSGRFAVSVLAAPQRVIAERLGEIGAPLRGLLDLTPHWRREEGAPAIIEDCLVWFECRVADVHPAATHQLVVGEVVAMGRSTTHGESSLVRFRSGYSSA
ncbi:NADH-FMN oxidoreductase RutF, flavin reductase (DIM6/NTAB) family [Paramicrobacterium humi]|uniref:NADH-FMN oxidoreductase RutF, flavin reductase (DIM6/NTAB) family n=1 Tax=Paramicrobacterium humi TaxID=640635 RepID=A0A1H4K810_9MICO|nr:flavin reductase family protein [Microbacterium humi]SEB54188.1 NADH-FMN oxidoreductase RutF, flavin reductase (DIM6/NTAB) family [Microbacterium humi]